MGTQGEGRRSGVLAGLAAFAGFVAVVAALEWLVGIGSDGIAAEVALFAALVVGLIPVLVWLGTAGYIERVSGGPSGLQVIFSAATHPISPTPVVDQQVVRVEQPHTEQMAMGYSTYVDDLEGRNVLSFDLGTSPDRNDVDGFLAHMTDLEYVTFAADGEFRGLMTATDFRATYAADADGFIARIESGEVTELAAVVTATVDEAVTNVEALRRMVDEDVDRLAVVDFAGRFAGVVTQSELARDVLVSLFDAADA